jgi:hypothetical protein
MSEIGSSTCVLFACIAPGTKTLALALRRVVPLSSLFMAGTVDEEGPALSPVTDIAVAGDCVELWISFRSLILVE